jgi:hypothetical protein
LRLITRYPWFGVGRGAFESTFPSVRLGRGSVVFTHPENIVTQWVSEWGIPIGLLSLAALAWALRPSRVRNRPTTPVGASCALLALGLQNLVDFSLEVPGIAVCAAILAAIVVGGDAAQSPHGEGDLNAHAKIESIGSSSVSPRRWPNALRMGPVLGSIAALVLTAAVEGHELFQEERRRFAEAEAVIAAAPSEVAPYLARIQASALRHPGAPYFPYLHALVLERRGDPRALRFAALTLTLSPVHGRVHLVLARALTKRAPAQARLEYRLAYEQDGTTFDGVSRTALALVNTLDDARELLPRDAERPGDLDPRNADAQALRDMFAVNLEPRLPSIAQALDTISLQLTPSLEAPRTRNVTRALRDVRANAAWCANNACLAAGLAEADVLYANLPHRCVSYSLRARLEAEGGNRERGFLTLENAMEDVEDRTTCLRDLAQMAAGYKNTSVMDRALDRLVDLGCALPAECKDNVQYAIGLEAGGRNPRGELRYVRKALERDALDVGLWRSRHSLCKQVALFGEAAEASERLAELVPAEHTQWVTEAAQNRAAARGNVPTTPR